jgi:FMN phosphatase YigB (HAD superfamily)
MPIRGVLFDVGGPLDTEVTRERVSDEHIRTAFAAAGHPVDDAAFAEAVRWAVDSFAPDAYQAIIWRLAARDVDLSERVYHAFAARAHERQVFELRAGIPELLDHLHTRGLHLGLAANQHHSIIAQLDAHGIGHYFHHREVSGTHGLRKPDVRLFLRACDGLGVRPVDCIMVATASTTTSSPRSSWRCAPCYSGPGVTARNSRTRGKRGRMPRCMMLPASHVLLNFERA